MKILSILILLAFQLSVKSQCLQPVWSDEFNEDTLNRKKWAFETGDGCPMCGWGNEELEYYTTNPKNLHIDNGILVIEAVKEATGASSFTSAKIRNLGLA